MNTETAHIEILTSEDGMEVVSLRCANAHAQVFLQGAHVSEYCPSGDENLLWMSQSANYALGKAIRGGIPICWPWFGASPEAAEPQHGVARQSRFEVVDHQIKDAFTSVTLRLDPKALADYVRYAGLELEVEVRLADFLWMEMRTTNHSAETKRINDCFHNYFSISDISKTQIPQLEKLTYLDKVQDFKQCEQQRAFLVDQEVDRVYQGVGNSVSVIPASDDQLIAIDTWGFENLIVWNPWSMKAKEMSDFDDFGYQQMICAEPANATYGSVEIPPGSIHRAGQKIQRRTR